MLFIDSTKNNTNSLLSVQNTTSAIIVAINNNHYFKAITQYVANSVRKTLGLSQKDSLVTSSQAIT
ncbi:hypothetical protein [Candidatus Hartigia pinicola]